MKRIITIETVKEAVEAAHAHFREEKGGKNADYIPYLKTCPPTFSASRSASRTAAA